MDTHLTSASHGDPAARPASSGSAAPRDPLIGQVLGERYRLVARIGEGGMGAVYRAEHVVLHKRMAVKVLRHHLSRDEDLVRRFQQEAIAASEIGQENIVAVTDFGRTPEGSVYFVMEELEGESLAALLAASGPLPVERAVLVLAQVCRALAAAHAHGIVHRDLKPDNVIVVRREDGTDFVKVVDFGISKTLGDGPGQRATLAGTIIGTPEYMAPEQGAAAIVDHRADVYAFGVLAYEILTRTLPFQGETAIATLLAHQTKAVEPPSRRRPGLPPALEALILRALQKRAEARHQSMAEVAADLTCVLAGFGLPPVYERPPAPPVSHGPLGGLTDRFVRGTPGAPHPRARADARQFHSTDRGVTVALEAQPAGAPPPRRGRALALATIAVTVVIAAGIVIARKVVGARPTSRVDASAISSTASAPPEPSQSRDLSSTAPALVEPSQSRAPAPGRDEARPGVRRDERGQGSTSTSTSTAAPAEMPAVRMVNSRDTVSNPPRTTSTGRVGSPGRATSVAGRQLGAGTRTEENPYKRLDDLKPDPF